MTSRRVDVYGTLLAEITSWKLPPGAPLREEELGSRLGVSRTPVREALARLRADGLVEQRAGQIAAVSPVDVDSTIAVYQARDALETYAVQLAAQSTGRGRFAELARDYESFAEDEGGPQRAVERLYDLSTAFDEALAEVVSNSWLLGPLGAARAALLRLRRLASLDPGRLTAAARQRSATCRAIAEGDAESAGRLNHERIQASLRHTLEVLLEGRAAPFVPPALPPATPGAPA